MTFFDPTGIKPGRDAKLLKFTRGVRDRLVSRTGTRRGKALTLALSPERQLCGSPSGVQLQSYALIYCRHIE